MTTKKTGIIGGAGPLASSLLYKKIIEKSYQRKIDHPELVILNQPFNFKMLEDKAVVQALLQDSIDTLILNKVDSIAIVCNSFHAFVPFLSFFTIKFIHLPEEVSRHALNKGYKKLLILGTSVTINNNLYANNLIEYFAPAKEDHLDVQNIIKRILQGQIEQYDIIILNEIINKNYKDHAIDGVILGCTELPVLHNQYPLTSKVPILDSIDILAQVIIDRNT